MRKIMIMLIVMIFVLSTSVFSFAGESPKEGSVQVGNDTVNYVDSGAYALLTSIKDLDKRDKIARLWLTPAYTETTIIHEVAENRLNDKEITKQDLKNIELSKEIENTDIATLQKLIDLDGNELDTALIELVENSVSYILNNPNVKVNNEFLNYLQEYTELNTNQLQSKQYQNSMEDLTDAQQLQQSSIIASPSVYPGYQITIIAKNKNVVGQVMASMQCRIDWTGNGTTIASLYPDTTWNVDFVYSVGGLSRNAQFVKTVSGKDIGYVQKGLSLVSVILPGPVHGEPTGVLVVDAQVRANGTVANNIIITYRGGIFLPTIG